METQDPEISVVVPVFNEEGNVIPLAEEIVAALSGRLRFEIVFVDDGSTDGSLERMRQARRDLGAAIRVVRLPENRGQSTAICAGVDAASSPVVATLDGDGQNDPNDLPKLYEILIGDGGGDLALVTGVRRVRHDSAIRRLSSRVASGVRRSVLRDGSTDTGSGTKVFRRTLFLNLPRFDHMHRFLPALFQYLGGKVDSTPVNHRPRQSGRSKYGVANRLWAGIVDLAGVVWLSRRRLRIDDAREDD